MLPALPKAGGSLIRTFSPNALDLSQATMIRIHAGEEIGGINIALRKGDLFRVSGHIVSAIPDFDAKNSAIVDRHAVIPCQRGCRIPASAVP
jgi:hypothetical protein